MSASLVGSEMCIRDRHCAAADGLGRPVGERLQVEVGHAVLHDAHQAGQPVSYTHLTLPTICSV
eukprot:10737814-Alexandrium_andersonii.AAC.1